MTLDFALVDVARGQPACQIITANVWDFHISSNFADCLLPSPKFALSIVAKTETICIIMLVNEGHIHARNKCFLYQNPHWNWWKNSSNAICKWRHQFSHLQVISSQSNSRGHASNITWPRIQYHVSTHRISYAKSYSGVKSSPHNNSECISCIPN